jgi:UDP-N-acetylmuramate dehydrogenase
MSLDEPFRRALEQRTRIQILFDEPAWRHASLAVGGPVDALAFPGDEGETAELVAFLRTAQVPFLPVGNWTNLIVRDGGYRGVLISLSHLRRIESRTGDGGATIAAGAGCPLAELVNLSLREGLTGLEFAAGIPGSLGGAIRMNAGAFGSEMKDVVESATILDVSGPVRAVPREALSFSYRTLDLPAETIIIGATVRLLHGAGERIASRVREILETRRQKHPLAFPNAGSVFKNPRECPAGRLIEAAGLKGTRIGDAEVSEKHANFIVNRGQATAGEVLGLIGLIRQRVLEHSGIALETEVKIIGEQA